MTKTINVLCVNTIRKLTKTALRWLLSLCQQSGRMLRADATLTRSIQSRTGSHSPGKARSSLRPT
jgi:hypothetical protein